MISERRVRKLLDQLCVQLGFCLPPEDAQRLASDPPTEVRAFTDALFSAEGFSPETADRHLYRRVRDMIASAFRESE